MSEGVSQDDEKSSADQATQQRATGDDMQISNAGDTHATASEEKIIWTPGFLLTFALILVLGISAESLFASAWANALPIRPWWVMSLHILLLAAGWLVLGLATRSRWIRAGCAFGGISTLFMGLDVFMNMQNIDPGSPVQSYINAAICLALLGAYIGLSVEGAPL